MNYPKRPDSATKHKSLYDIVDSIVYWINEEQEVCPIDCPCLTENEPKKESRNETSRDAQFFMELEEILDEQFPKMYEEGPEKRANRRGAALVLFAEANRIHNKIMSFGPSTS